MGMSWGMIGALGGMGQGTGLGGAMMAQGDFLRKQDEADAAMTRQQALEKWRMSTQEEFSIRSEARAEKRQIDSEGRAAQRRESEKDADFERLKREAPTRRQMKAEDYVSEQTQKLGLETEFGDQIAANKKKLTEAGQTDADRELKRANAEYISGAKTLQAEAAASARGNGANKYDVETIKSLDDQIEKATSDIRKARLDGTLNDDKLTPAQAAELRRLNTLKQQRADLYANLRGGGASSPQVAGFDPADPAGRRQRVTTAPASGGGMMGNAPPKRAASEAQMADQVRGGYGPDPATIAREISAVEADLQKVSDPKSKSDLQEYLADLRSQQSRIRIKEPGPQPQPAQAPAAKPSAAPAQEFTEDPAMTSKVESEQREMAEGKRMKYSAPEVKAYAEALSSLRKKMAERADREAAERRAQQNKGSLPFFSR